MPASHRNLQCSDMPFLSHAWSGHGRQQGFTLVSVLIAVAVVSTAFLTYTVAVNDGMFFRKFISSRQQVYEIIESMKNELAGQFNAKAALLSDVSSLANIEIPVSNASKFVFDQKLYQTLPTNADSPSDLTPLLVRCQTNTQVTPTFYHFCLGLRNDPNAASGSMAAASYGVIELAIKTKDMRTFADISKDVFTLPANQATSGLEVYYSMYWTTVGHSGKLHFHRKNGRYLAGRLR